MTDPDPRQPPIDLAAKLRALDQVDGMSVADLRAALVGPNDSVEHQASRDMAAKLLDSAAEVSTADLRSALASALKRIDALELELEGIGAVFRWFNENTPSLDPDKPQQVAQP